MATQKMALPEDDDSRNVLRNVEGLFNTALVNRVFQDGSISCAKLVAAACQNSGGDVGSLTVVDPGGNGDFETLGEAMAAPGRTSGDIILITGKTTEVQDTNWVSGVIVQGIGAAYDNFNDSVTGSVVDLGTLYSIVANNAGGQFMNIGIMGSNDGNRSLLELTGGTFSFEQCTFHQTRTAGTPYLINAATSGQIRIFGCNALAFSGRFMTVDGSMSVVVDNSFIRSNAPSVLSNNTGGAGSFLFKNSRLNGVQFDLGTGISVELFNCEIGILTLTQVPASFLAVCCQFDQVNSTPAFNNAPFYQCAWNAQTNITADAGALNGTNVEY